MVMPEIRATSQQPSAASAPGSNPGAPFRRELIALRAVFGQDEANHGVERYRVGRDGLVWVPLEAVAFLTNKGGFVVAKTTAGLIPASGTAEHPGSTRAMMPAGRAQPGRDAGMVKLHHDDAAGCNYDGCEYFSDENGDVVVPVEAASELLAHGFAPVLEAAFAPKPSKPSRGARSRKG
jgi:hypothetical protein